MIPPRISALAIGHSNGDGCRCGVMFLISTSCVVLTFACGGGPGSRTFEVVGWWPNRRWLRHSPLPKGISHSRSVCSAPAMSKASRALEAVLTWTSAMEGGTAQGCNSSGLHQDEGSTQSGTQLTKFTIPSFALPISTFTSSRGSLWCFIHR